MRQRILDHGASSFADYELVEMLLYPAIPRRDTKPLAKSLIDHFGSFLALCQATPDELTKFKLNANAITLLMLPRICAVSLGSKETKNLYCFDDWSRLMTYVNRYTSNNITTGTSILYMNSRNELLLDSLLPAGSEISTLHRYIAEQALHLNATALIIVYISPKRPANVISQHVQGLKQALSPLSVSIHDVLLLGEGWTSSLQQEGMLNGDFEKRL
ncbi:hypothetical protein DM15PD_01390 [Aristophania vespae]|nr:hypothetical protein DM15PD_01390 [Aristophania vespae]